MGCENCGADVVDGEYHGRFCELCEKIEDIEKKMDEWYEKQRILEANKRAQRKLIRSPAYVKPEPVMKVK